MSCDVDVDTDALHRAAEMLRDAAMAFAPPPGAPGPAPAEEHAAGGSAAGRQALRGIVTRVEQADQAAAWLVDAATRLAGMLDHAADIFEQAEALCGGG